jgi:hypothetical protein
MFDPNSVTISPGAIAPVRKLAPFVTEVSAGLVRPTFNTTGTLTGGRLKAGVIVTAPVYTPAASEAGFTATDTNAGVEAPVCTIESQPLPVVVDADEVNGTMPPVAFTLTVWGDGMMPPGSKSKVRLEGDRFSDAASVTVRVAGIVSGEFEDSEVIVTEP